MSLERHTTRVRSRGGASGVRHARFTIHFDLGQTGSDAAAAAFRFIQRTISYIMYTGTTLYIFTYIYILHIIMCARAYILYILYGYQATYMMYIHIRSASVLVYNIMCAHNVYILYTYS